MINIVLHRAQPIGELEPSPITIVVDDPLPSEVFGDGARHMMRADAYRLADALLHALPGGTVDQLLIRLMEQKAAFLRIPYEIIPAPSLAYKQAKRALSGANANPEALL